MRRSLLIFINLILSSCLLFNSGCKKELSCEDCKEILVPTETGFNDDATIVDRTLTIPTCVTCDSTKPLALNTWGFTVNHTYACGIIDSSLFDTQKYSIDFWGHLKCSVDTGFRIVSFFYPLQFNANRFGASTDIQSFILQDRINYMNPWNGYILRTDGTTPDHTLRIIVDTFMNNTKLLVGRFYGYAYTKNDEKSYVNGKFRLIVH